MLDLAHAPPRACDRWAAGACWLAVWGCAPAPAPAPAAPPAVVTVPRTAPAATAAPTTRAATEHTPRGAAADAPDSYVEAQVGGVVQTAGGQAVVLVDDDDRVAIPIFIGGTEALAIELRHNKKRFARPLTHDLLDEIMYKLGGKLVRVQIDAIRDDTFIASVFVRRNDEIIELDARASDAIALAIGAHVTIYVAPTVVSKAGVKRPALTPTPGSAAGGGDPHPI